MTKTTTATARRRRLAELGGRPASQPYSERFEDFGSFLQAVHYAGVHGIETADPKLDYKIDPLDVRDFNAAATGADGAVPSRGGFLVQPDHATTLHERMYATGQVLSRTTPWPSPRETLRIPQIDEDSRVAGSRFGGLSMAWTEPGAEIAASNPKFRLSEFNRNKLAGLVYASGELIDDAPQLEATFTRLYGLEATFVVENAILSGTGAGQPLGILNSGALITVAKESGQAAATIVAANVVNMAARFWAAGWPRATWLANQDALPQLLGLRWTDNAGATVPLVSYGPEGGMRLMGAPLILTEHNATLGTVGDIVLCDLSQFILTEPRGLDIAFSPDVKFTSDEGAWRFRLRIDGAPAWASPTTPLNGSSTVSPFIALATRD